MYQVEASESNLFYISVMFQTQLDMSCFKLHLLGQEDMCWGQACIYREINVLIQLITINMHRVRDLFCFIVVRYHLLLSLSFTVTQLLIITITLDKSYALWVNGRNQQAWVISVLYIAETAVCIFHGICCIADELVATL